MGGMSIAEKFDCGCAIEELGGMESVRDDVICPKARKMSEYNILMQCFLREGKHDMAKCRVLHGKPRVRAPICEWPNTCETSPEQVFGDFRGLWHAPAKSLHLFP